MDKQKLKSIMVYNDDTQSDLAEYLGISNQTFSRKINEKGKSEFGSAEIRLIKARYDLKPEEIDQIFFDKLVS
ncbi:helix-turn-helix transcriptional regulator [Tetragenococcus halophilus]|uniref:Uncharacterized protein n=1 Tax=Tetragenococcus muriaticus PMC-11-5 TaxID=1302649 RepID=A0A091CDS5_9ENTE|nr:MULTISPECIES: helix-turn-helix transcriptional regulator [Tetragenococcus]KFN92403.1 hypothetical protein TMUPMC115_0915 [Tetragenococcus muriaticus PMC-11-5]NWN99297.1 helix-turn-helix transcriptional regulator [Tetragenococcus halophilus]